MTSSASVVMSRTVIGQNNYYFFTQLGYAALGLGGLFILSRIDYRFWSKIATPLMILSVFLLLAVFIPGIGFEHNGATRWITIFGFQFQPSEAMKLSLIIFLAAWFEKKGDDVRDIKRGVLPFLAITGFVVGIILILQRDMGTASVLIASAGVLYVLAGAKISHILSTISVLAASLWLAISAGPFQYRLSRLTVFLNPGSDVSGAGYQIRQAKVAIGSGGLFGLGFGRSRQKFNYLPEAATDSIFAIIAEELGLIGASLIVLIILLFVLRGYKIAKQAPDVFSSLVAAGITTWVAAQSFINILAILGLMPLTGVPLPFISYGGTSLVMLLVSCGILLNISKHAVEGGNNANNRFGRWNWRSYLPSTSSRHRASKIR
jgi:cell division protein FtsW